MKKVGIPLRALWTEPEEFKMMPLDCKTRLHGDKLLQHRKIAIPTLNGLGAGPADQQMTMPGPRSDEPVIASLIMHPFQIPQIL